MTSDEYNAFLSDEGELGEEGCGAICEQSDSEYTSVLGCELTGQATGDPENPPTATVTCSYENNPC